MKIIDDIQIALEAAADKFEWSHLFSSGSIFTSLVLFIVVTIIRRILIRHVRKDTEILGRDQRRWIVRIRNVSAVLIVIGLILIWAPQLRTFAISIAAFAVALVVATKEMILCLTGAIMRTTSQPFKIGEWITVDKITGEVIDLDAFSFRLQEVDMDGKTYQFTGRTVTIPNSKLFTSNIENANFFKLYIFEDVRVSVQFMDIDPAAALVVLREIAEKHFAPYRKDAVEFSRRVRRRSGNDIGSAEPVFDLATTDLGHYLFHVRFFLPTVVATGVGLEVSAEFLSRVHDMRKANKADDKKDEAKKAEEAAAGDDVAGKSPAPA